MLFNTWRWVMLALFLLTLFQSFLLFSKRDTCECDGTPGVVPERQACRSSSPPSSPYLHSSSSSSPSPSNYFGLRTKIPTQFSSSLKKAFAEHEKIQEEMIKGPKENARWVVFTSEGVGLANRLQGITGCFLFALLTKRAFAVQWVTGYAGPNDNINDEGEKIMMSDEEIFNPPFNWSLANVGSMETVRFLSGDLYSGHLNEFLCSDFQERFKDRVVDIHTWDYFAPFIAHNSLYKAQVLKWFGTLDNIDGPILRYLLRLTPKLQQEVDTFVATQFKTFTVGMHLRMTGNRNYKMEKEHETVAFQCAGVPFGDTINPSGIVSFPGFDEDGEFRTLASSDVTIFLATDKPETAAAAKLKYGNRLIMLENSPITRASREGIIRGVLDLFILAQCDDFVLSFQSSYGRAAAALAGVAPLVVTHEAKCMRDITPEPCACGWLKIGSMHCYNATLHDTPYSVNQVGCATCDGISRMRQSTLNKK